MEKIKLPILLGPDSKDKLIGQGFCTLTLTDKFLITRTQYSCEKLKDSEDILSAMVVEQINEKSYILKSTIITMAVAWDNDDGINYIVIGYHGSKFFFNVESAGQGDELLTKLTEWWLS